MIAHLRGRILDKHPNRIVVDVNGVGYDVAVPLSTFYGLGEPGAEIVEGRHRYEHVVPNAVDVEYQPTGVFF